MEVVPTNAWKQSDGFFSLWATEPHNLHKGSLRKVHRRSQILTKTALSTQTLISFYIIIIIIISTIIIITILVLVALAFVLLLLLLWLLLLLLLLFNYYYYY
jgi:hypothetical protein